jgi:hypothetical protein
MKEWNKPSKCDRHASNLPFWLMFSYCFNIMSSVLPDIPALFEADKARYESS